MVTWYQILPRLSEEDRELAIKAIAAFPPEAQGEALRAEVPEEVLARIDKKEVVGVGGR